MSVLTAVSAFSGPGADTPASLRPGRSAGHTVEAAPSAPGAARPLPFFYDLYTFRGRGDSTVIVTAFAVEAGRLETEAAKDGVRYRFSVTLVLADAAVHSVTNTHDTVYVDVGRPMPDDHLLYTHVEVLAPPSVTTRQRVIMTDATTPGIGQLYSEYFPIPDYSGNDLMLSDIALGQPEARTGWTRRGATLALLPTSQFPSSAFDVYYEIYNLPAGHQYTTEIAIEHIEDPETERSDGREPVRLRFAGVSGAGRDDTLPELRRVQASLSRGRYRLTVTITDLATGETATQSRLFRVQGRGRGATMVAALPAAHEGGARK